MAHDTEITEKIDCIRTLIDQLEAGDLSITNAEQLHDEGQQLLDECRTLITQGDGEIIEREG
jgi:exodeoxyribonuclease VII small subunit